MSNDHFCARSFGGEVFVAGVGLAGLMAMAALDSANRVAEIVAARRGADQIAYINESFNDLVEANAAAQRIIAEQEMMIECLQAELASR